MREIHISGGSWENSVLVPDKKIRRDTHNDAVPEEVFQLLELTMQRCPNLKYVVLEQLGNSLKTESSKARFRHDFLKMEGLVQKSRRGLSAQMENLFLPLQSFSPGFVVEDDVLHGQQMQLSHILETAASYDAAVHLLQSSSLANSEWKIENWEPHMLETAINIAQKWKK